MKQHKQDRRSQRTYHLVSTAMMALLIEKRYDAITVQDILERADIGRSTFYTHYYDKEDVLVSIAEQMLDVFSQRMQQAEAGHGIVPALELFRHVQQQPQFFQAMLRGQGGEVLWKAGITLLSRNIEHSLISSFAGKRSPTVPLAVVSQYLAGAFLNLLKWWLDAEMPYAPEQLDEMFQQLALPGVWATVGESWKWSKA
ncbi:MAG TPA: TetR/AcrR family transcriptional regulator [Ktedonobacteraceae bacterium]